MKKLFLFYLQFSVIFLHCNVNAQWKEEKLITFDKTNLSNFEALQISSNGLLLVKEGIGTKSIYSLINVFTQDKKLIFETDAERSNARFNNCNDNYVIISVKKDNLWSVIIYEILTNNSIPIKSSEGHIGSASIFDENNILYQLRAYDESYAAIYFYNKDKNEKRFITYGIGEYWSPNGKYFLVLKENNEHKVYAYGIFSKEGNELLEIENSFGIYWIQWSPYSKNLLYKHRDLYNSFGIISLEHNKTLSIKNVNNFSYFTSQNGYFSGIVSPLWCNNEDSILFRKTTDDGHDILESSIWLFTKNNRKIKQISKTYFTNELIWDYKVTNDNVILFLTKSKNENKVYMLSTLKK